MSQLKIFNVSIAMMRAQKNVHADATLARVALRRQFCAGFRRTTYAASWPGLTRPSTSCSACWETWMPGIADKFTQSAQDRLLWPGMTKGCDARDDPQDRRATRCAPPRSAWSCCAAGCGRAADPECRPCARPVAGG